MDFLQYAFALVVTLGVLVTVHEFGHYIFARIFWVKAEIFSIGFGPKLWSKQLGETELRVSAIPLGGYVKLLGEDRDSEMSEEEQKRALHRQAAWKTECASAEATGLSQSEFEKRGDIPSFCKNVKGAM